MGEHVARGPLDPGIRAFDADDLDDLGDLESLCPRPIPAERLGRILSRGASRCWVADRSGEVVGYVLGRYRTGRFELVRIAVDPMSQGRGLASRLLRRIEERSVEPGGIVEATVPESNLDAQRLLRSAGFVCVQSHRGRFVDPEEDGYVFRKRRGMATRVDAASFGVYDARGRRLARAVEG